MAELVYRTDGAWGGGLDRPLTSAEADGNIHLLSLRIAEVESQSFNGESVASLVDNGNGTFTALGDKGSNLGTVTLPVYVPPDGVDWQAQTAYGRGAIVFDPQFGRSYVCQAAHTSTADFAADAAAGSWSLLAQGIALAPQAAPSPPVVTGSAEDGALRQAVADLIAALKTAGVLT